MLSTDATSTTGEYKTAVYDSDDFSPLSKTEVYVYKGGNTDDLAATVETDNTGYFDI